VSLKDEIAAIYDDSYKEITGYCVRRLFATDLARDAASAVFVKFVEKYPGIRERSRDELRDWLFGTASNVVASFRRDRRKRKQIDIDVAMACESSSTSESSDVWPFLYRAVEKLKPLQQEIISLRFYRGLETSKIAELLGVSHVNVRVQLSRAIKQLRKELRKPLGIFEETL